MVLHKRELEKGILAGIDRLVHILIDSSCTEGRRKDILLEQAVQMVRELTPLLLTLLGGKEEHLENLLRQLISQKLPPGCALDSFGHLGNDLDWILASAFFKAPEEASSETVPEETVSKEAVSEKSELENHDSEDTKESAESLPNMDLFRRESEEVAPGTDYVPKPAFTFASFLRRRFPDALIQEKYLFRCLCVDFYLPDKKLAILLLYPGVRTIPVYDLLLKKEGITLLKLQPEELEQPAGLLQKLSHLK